MTPWRKYRGLRTTRECVVLVNDEPLPPRLDLVNHSPAGFEWGYSGSGPAQLALAILCDALAHDSVAFESGKQLLGYHRPVDVAPDDPVVLLTSDEIAVRLHQRFKSEAIARLTREESWEMHGLFVRQLLQRWEADR